MSSPFFICITLMLVVFTAPAAGFCSPPSVIQMNIAGYACQIDEYFSNAVGFSNGGMTQMQCEVEVTGGSWKPYGCFDAIAYWYTIEDKVLQEKYTQWWNPVCCSGGNDDTPSAAPSSLQLCPPSSVFMEKNTAGYSCNEEDGTQVGFSNKGMTEAECVDVIKGSWNPYPCAVGLQLFEAASDQEDKERYIDWYADKCCESNSHAPTAAPTAAYDACFKTDEFTWKTRTLTCKKLAKKKIKKIKKICVSNKSDAVLVCYDVCSMKCKCGDDPSLMFEIVWNSIKDKSSTCGELQTKTKWEQSKWCDRGADAYCPSTCAGLCP